MLHSLAGGTGSGLGARLAEEIRDLYPQSPLATCSFAACPQGETVLQNYNSLLSLTSISSSSDFVGLFSNETLMQLVANNNDRTNSKTCATIAKMNEYAAKCLAGQILPVTQTRNHRQFDKFQLWDWITNVTPLPSMRYAGFASSNWDEKYQSWSDRTTTVCRCIFPMERPRITFTASIKFRGVQKPEFWESAGKIEERLKTRLMNPMFLSTTHSFLYGVCPKSQVKSIEICYNSNDVLELFEPVYKKAKLLFEKRAYLHWYERYAKDGVDQIFEEGFECIRRTIQEYL